MLNRKLLEILVRLGLTERKKLRLFIQSPYFNNGANATSLLQLLDHILAFQADENHPELEKKRVFELFYPGKPFIEAEKNALDSLSSDLFLLVRRFITQQKQEALEPFQHKEALSMLEFYREHSLEDRFWQSLQALRKTQEKQLIQDAQYFYTQFQVEEETFKFLSMYNSFEDDANLNHAHENLDKFYAITKLEYTCLAEHQNKLSQNANFLNSDLNRAVLSNSAPGGNLFTPLLYSYHLIHILLHDVQNEFAFNEYANLLKNHSKVIQKEKLYDLHAFYREFWVRRYFVSGDQYSRSKLFEVYKEHFEQGYFDSNGKIVVSSFINLITLSLKLGHFDWAQKVLEAHPPEKICGTIYPAEVHSLNYGEYYFLQTTICRSRKNGELQTI